MATSVLKSWLKIIKRIAIVVLVLTPVWMFLIWFFWPKRKLTVAIIDKTVLTTQAQEHISFNWILNHEKFVKNNEHLYNPSTDYFGFFPEENEKFRLKGLERFTRNQLIQLSADADLVYLTDAYGIYRNEWIKHSDTKERSGIIYGGTSDADMQFLQLMQQNKKLIIAEFNSLGSPTSPIVRSEFEKTFGIKWLNWIGRYFAVLDTSINTELPKWMIKNYLLQHNHQWSFKGSGIVFVRSDDRIEILSYPINLTVQTPLIYATAEGKNYYQLPEKIKYNYWFEVNEINQTYNHSIANFSIETNVAGTDSLLRWGIPKTFPAVSVHINNGYRFFYFSGDFCDNPIHLFSAYFKWVQYFKWMFYNTQDPEERKSFFWKFYSPLVTKILNDYYQSRMQ